VGVEYTDNHERTPVEYADNHERANTSGIYRQLRNSKTLGVEYADNHERINSGVRLFSCQNKRKNFSI
jgi:hypothetical protein